MRAIIRYRVDLEVDGVPITTCTGAIEQSELILKLGYDRWDNAVYEVSRALTRRRPLRRHEPPTEETVHRIEVWEEGYRVSGNHGGNFLAGTFDAVDFEDACQQLAAQRKNNPKGWGPPESHSVKDGVHAWWGCRWYRSEKECPDWAP